MEVANQDIAIKERAYAIWEEEGRPHGRDRDHWYRAAQEVAGPGTKRSTARSTRPRKAAAPKGRLRQAVKSALS